MTITAEALHRVGVEVSPDRFEAMVLEAVEGLREVYQADPRRELTPAEVQALQRGGFELEQQDLGDTDPLARTAAEYAALLATSRAVPESAEALGVDSSRVRQRLAARTLYGIKVRSGWKLPSFQFEPSGGTVPGIEEVLPRLDPALHPVAVHRWFVTPTPDLELEGESVSPLTWLRAGGSPRQVGELAAGL